MTELIRAWSKPCSNGLLMVINHLREVDADIRSSLLVNVFNNDLHICRSCRGVILIPPALCDLHKGFLHPLDKSHKAGRTRGADYRQYNKLAESCQYRRRKFIIRKLKVYFQKKTRSPQEPTAGSAPETSAAKRRGLKIALAKPFQCPAA